MTAVVLIDHLAAVRELVAEALRERRGHEVTAVADAQSAIAFAESSSTTPPDAVIVDFLQPHHSCNGLDIMMAFSRWCPESAIVVYTEGGCATTLLTVAWEAIGPASAVSKLSPVGVLCDTIDTVVRDGSAEVDPLLRSILPRERSPWRTVDAYRRLVLHVGHAKLWLALLASDLPPTYKQVAGRAGLSVNTIRNYREDLLPELRLHGLTSPSLREMHQFAYSVRPLLHPVLLERTGHS